MCPQFIHVMANGDVWFSISQEFTPVGTIAGTFRVYAGAHTQKLGTLSGNAGSYSVSGATGKRGNEIT
jgi:hypothetical protein